MKHSEFLGKSFAFGHLAANVRVRCRDFSKLRIYDVYSNRRPPSLFGGHCEILRWRTLRKTLKRWWRWLEKRRGATVSGGDETGYKTAATAGDERDGGDRWGNVYGRRGVRIWWGRDGSAWRQRLVAELFPGYLVWHGLRRLPCEWAGRKSQWRRRQWIGSGSSEWCGGSCSIPDEP